MEMGYVAILGYWLARNLDVGWGMKVDDMEKQIKRLEREADDEER